MPRKIDGPSAQVVAPPPSSVSALQSMGASAAGGSTAFAGPRAAGEPAPAGRSDRELLDGIRQADEACFNELYDRYFQRIYNFVHGRLRNHADTEEIVQETFVSVFKSIDNYRGQASLLSWIFGIAKNLANNSIRRSQSQREKLATVDSQLLAPREAFTGSGPEERLQLRRYAEVIRSELCDVADWQSEIFAMRHLDNLSIREIAARTDRSSDAIRSSLYRIKRLIIDAADLDGGRSAQ